MIWHTSIKWWRSFQGWNLILQWYFNLLYFELKVWTSEGEHSTKEPGFLYELNLIKNFWFLWAFLCLHLSSIKLHFNYLSLSINCSIQYLLYATHYALHISSRMKKANLSRFFSFFFLWLSISMAHSSFQYFWKYNKIYTE